MYHTRFVMAAVLSVSPLVPATLPPGFTEQSIGGLSSPTAMTFAPDGRLFVCQQTGALRVIKNGALLATPFLTVTTDASGERGLLGVAFDPNFAANQFVYVYYTATTTPRHNRISRFTAAGDVTVAASEVVVLDLDNLSSATNHNGGAIHFGPDGKLYVAVGENANAANAQTLSNRLGKILRINADGSIPTDNPLYNTATGANRSIWAFGLRNPFTFTFQPGTGRMFINDVGQVTWEEINDGIAGSNYGWPAVEGVAGNPLYRDPMFAYGHGSTSSTGCAITGGAFYNPATGNFPAAYVGQYFFADFCTGWIRLLNTATFQATGFASGIPSPVDLAVGPEGSLYYLARDAGAVFKVDFTGGQAPQITQQPQNRTVSAGQPATFTVSASGAPPLTFQWQRNGGDIQGATAASYTLNPATLGDNGAQFRCVVSNGPNSATSDAAVLTVTPNQPPAVTILAPTTGATYAGGDVIQYSGAAIDPEEGPLPVGALTWRVDLHHETHTHPFLQPITGQAAGAFTIPASGETSPNVWYRIYLTAVDSGGASATVFFDLLPKLATLQFETVPPALQVTLDGQPAATPLQVTGVVGIVRTLGVVSPQDVNAVRYQFVSWSDGGAAAHSISTPPNGATYTASFQTVPLCVYTLSRADFAASPAGDLGRVDVSAGPGCAWSAASDSAWLTVTAGSAGAGNGTVRFVAAANALLSARSGVITIGGVAFPVRQASTACQFTFASRSLSIPPEGGTFPVGVTAGGGCAVEGSSSASWIVVAPGGATFTGPPNPGPAARGASIAVAGQLIQILQAAPGAAAVFTDVPSSHPYFDAIGLIRQRGITTGCTAALFCPDSPTTRGQMAVFLVRALVGGDTFPFPAAPYFSDVPSNHPYFAHIQKLRELGITAGCTAAAYCPDDPVTRGQMAAFLIRSRYLLTSGQAFPFPPVPYFDDVPLTHPFFDGVQKLRELAVTSGCTPTRFCPDNPTTRGQMAVFLERALIAP